MKRQPRAPWKLLAARLVFPLWLGSGCESPRAQAPPQLAAAPTVPKPARETPPPNLYKPRPRTEWGGQDGGPAERTVVVIASRFAASEVPWFGNGVIVGGGGETNGAKVLTCAHLLERDGKPAIETRVGIFAHSFEPPMADAPEYQELPAKVLLRDTEADLALLEVEPRGTLQVARIDDSETLIGQMHLISIVPFGEIAHMRAWHPNLHPGMSGSPSVDAAGRIRGITMGYFSEHPDLGVFVQTATIRKFLERAPQ